MASFVRGALVGIVLLAHPCFARDEQRDERLLHDPVLEFIDGIAGIFDGIKVKESLWLLQEVRAMHAGTIKLNDKGVPDPRTGKPHDLVFQGQKRTIQEFMAFEKQHAQLSAADQAQLQKLFLQLKVYFGLVNDIMLAKAQGAQPFMIKLIGEFCRKHNRPHSLLLKWNSTGQENEMYEQDVHDFASFYDLTSDLVAFTKVLIASCPKALAQAKGQPKN